MRIYQPVNFLSLEEVNFSKKLYFSDIFLNSSRTILKVSKFSICYPLKNSLLKMKTDDDYSISI